MPTLHGGIPWMVPCCTSICTCAPIPIENHGSVLRSPYITRVSVAKQDHCTDGNCCPHAGDRCSCRSTHHGSCTWINFWLGNDWCSHASGCWCSHGGECGRVGGFHSRDRCVEFSRSQIRRFRFHSSGQCWVSDFCCEDN